jgi:aldose 1-epimerase
MIELRQGAARVVIEPALGGSILNFDVAGKPVLRPAASNADHPMEAAYYPLAPWANRIEAGRFHFGGHDVQLARNWSGSAHPLHGMSWLRPWSIVRASASEVHLRDDYGGGEWPWAYCAEQSITLTGSSLAIGLAVTNRHDAPMPAGLGFHPFFHRGPGARLEAKLGGVWCADETVLPTTYQEGQWPVDWSRGAVLADIGVLVDHCYAPWSGEVRLLDGAGRVTTISGGDASRLHLYVPTNQDYLCIEPVSHLPNPFAICGAPDTGLATLAPGETLALHMLITIEDHPMTPMAPSRRSPE